MDFLLSPEIVGGICGALGVFVLALILPRRSCPRCKAVLPRFRMPTDPRQARDGGWQCPFCRARIARDGTLLSDP